MMEKSNQKYWVSLHIAGKNSIMWSIHTAWKGFLLPLFLPFTAFVFSLILLLDTAVDSTNLSLGFFLWGNHFLPPICSCDIRRDVTCKPPVPVLRAFQNETVLWLVSPQIFHNQTSSHCWGWRFRGLTQIETPTCSRIPPAAVREQQF